MSKLRLFFRAIGEGVCAARIEKGDCRERVRREQRSDSTDLPLRINLSTGSASRTVGLGGLHDVEEVAHDVLGHFVADEELRWIS